jgi:glutamyl-tRNA(Gln) amidotransferase subunit E
MNYNELGLMAGIEIHQQLDTGEKLFCRCPTVLRDIGDRCCEFRRYLRATESELGEVDRAAAEEMRQTRLFTYYGYDTTCLVEADEEPPRPLNREALTIGLTIARIMGMHPVKQVHTMRKLVIDGSNTSGFQRTALVALNGRVPAGARVETICLEEEACQRVKDEVFSLDRLGIPLVEITTAPDMRTPEEVRDVAAEIGMILRSTGKVKRGLGTIRQDVNISIRDGARVEIKGVQELDLIDEVVRREVQRQVNLLAIRDELHRRGASAGEAPVDATAVFTGTKSSIIKKAKRVLALRLRGFAGLVGREIQPGRRLGSELADYARKCGVGGLFHTDELPAYGVTSEEVAALRALVGAEDDDAVVMVADTPGKAACAIDQVARRASLAFDGVPEETRKMLEDGSTSYMRPLPGAARMYPETDVFPVTVTPEFWDGLIVPELLTVKAERFAGELGIDSDLARQVAFSPYLPLFEEAVAVGIRPTLAARTLVGTLRELRRDGIPVDMVPGDAVISLLARVEAEDVAKEAIPAVLAAVAGGASLDGAIRELAPSVSGDELVEVIRRVISEREDFVRERGERAAGPLMGVVMKEMRGRVDGKKISEALKREIAEFLQ